MVEIDHQPKSSSVVVSAASSTSSPQDLKLSSSIAKQIQPVETGMGSPQPPETSTVSPWSIVANYHEMIGAPAVGTDGTFVYSAGGYHSFPTAVTNGFYRYDPVANVWMTLPPLPTGLTLARGVY